MTTLLLVDTNDLFEQSVKDALNREPLTWDCKVIRLSPNVLLDPEPMAADMAHRTVARHLDTSLSAIFVDLVVYESPNDEPDREGVRIALGIKAALPDLPVYVVTGRTSRDCGDAISYAGLERRLNGVLFKTFLTGTAFSAERLHLLLHPVRPTDQAVAAGKAPVVPPRSIAKNPHSVEAKFGKDTLPQTVRIDVERVGADDFWALLERLLPDSAEGVLSTLPKGRSGATIFTVDAMLTSQSPATKWIIKVARSKEGLARELDNYERVRVRLKPEMYAHPLHLNVTSQGTLHGIISELKDEYLTFASYMRSEPSVMAVSKTAQRVAEMLASLYGQKQMKRRRPWLEFFDLTDSQRLDAQAGLDKVAAALRALGFAEELRLVSEFLKNEGKLSECLRLWHQTVDLRFIHGDLNSGNLLLRRDGSPCLIDLEQARDAPASIDFAKLQRDLIVRVADYGTFKELSWSNLGAWRKVHEILRLAEESASASKLPRFVGVLRTDLKKNAELSTSQMERDVASLSMYSRALANDGLPLPKRAFAVLAVADLGRHVRAQAKRLASG